MSISTTLELDNDKFIILLSQIYVKILNSHLDTPSLARSKQISPLLFVFYSSKLRRYVFHLPTSHALNKVHYKIMLIIKDKQ